MSEKLEVTYTAVIVAGLAFAALALTVILSIIGQFELSGQSATLSRQAQQAEQTHTAVCAYKSQLSDEVKSGQKFLFQHPNGAFGFTAVQLQQSIDKEQNLLSSLATLDC